MIELRMEMQANRAKKTLTTMFKKVKDLKPVWKDFRTYWQTDLMPRSWNSKGKLMEGQRWTALTPAYLKWKRSKNNTGSKKLMMLSGKMFRAATGGQGWSDKIDKKSAEFSISGEDYFNFVQTRKKNPRLCFYTKKEDLPNRAWAYLIKITEEYIVGENG